jgi:hypothetical protein
MRLTSNRSSPRSVRTLHWMTRLDDSCVVWLNTVIATHSSFRTFSQHKFGEGLSWSAWRLENLGFTGHQYVSLLFLIYFWWLFCSTCSDFAFSLALLREDLILICPFSCNEAVERKRGKNRIRMAACTTYFHFVRFYSIVSYDLLCSVWRSFVPFLREWDGTERMRWQVWAKYQEKHE